MVLASVLGIRLLLWTGRSVPVPAPTAALEALEDVEVTNDAGGPDGFRLTFNVGKRPTGEYELVGEPALQPMSRVVIGVVVGARPEVLCDGLVTHHQMQATWEPGRSLFTVIGRDLTQALDLKEEDDEYPNQPDWLIVSQVLARPRYAAYGLVPTPTPTTDVPLELFRVTRQHETDLAFVRRLAEANGHVFYIEPVTFGVNRAYWGPEVRTGIPQPALKVDLGEATNVRTLDVSHDALAPEGVAGTFVDPVLKQPWPLPQLPSLRFPPLAARTAPTLRTRRLRSTARKTPAEAATAVVAAVSTTPEPVTATGETDGVRYGHVLRARRLVGVAGAGLTSDGFYYVRRVTHRLRQGEWTQSFTLSREGTGTLSPVVPP